MTIADLHEPVEALPELDQEEDRAALPVRGMAALAISATFAVWTSLSCFVC